MSCENLSVGDAVSATPADASTLVTPNQQCDMHARVMFQTLVGINNKQYEYELSTIELCNDTYPWSDVACFVSGYLYTRVNHIILQCRVIMRAISDGLLHHAEFECRVLVKYIRQYVLMASIGEFSLSKNANVLLNHIGRLYGMLSDFAKKYSTDAYWIMMDRNMMVSYDSGCGNSRVSITIDCGVDVGIVSSTIDEIAQVLQNTPLN